MALRDTLPSLVIDIGGTNTRVALARDQVVQIDTIERFANRDHDGLPSVIEAYLARRSVAEYGGICVALAGPVRDGVGSLTNLDWIVDRDVLLRDTGAPVAEVINDLQAQGLAIDHTAPGTVTTLVDGPEVAAHQTKLVVNLGTGFNCAPVYETPAGRLVTPSEAGHINLSAEHPDDHALVAHIEARHGFAAVEDVLSGRGLANLDAWVSGTKGAPRQLSGAEVMDALAQGDAIAQDTMKVFARIFGSVTGNLGLIHLPFGGIYLVGGVARAVAPWLVQFGFVEAMRAKGRFGDLVADFAVSVVEDDYAALTGCARHLSRF